MNWILVSMIVLTGVPPIVEKQGEFDSPKRCIEEMLIQLEKNGPPPKEVEPHLAAFTLTCIKAKNEKQT